MPKQLKFNQDARASIKKGIDKIAQAVKMTLGPRGRAAVIEKGYGAPQITFDGVTVAKEVELEDKFENLGADLLKQAADKTNDKVGDGTTTSVVLAHTLIEQGENTINSQGFNVIQLAKELENAGKEVIKALELQKEEVEDTKKVQEVATLSAKDKTIGELIGNVIAKVGKDGVITISDSNTIDSDFEVVEGMQFDKGYIAPYMVTNAEKMTAELTDPYIIVTDKKISNIKELLPSLEKVLETGKRDIVIIAEDVEGEALTTLVVNKLKGTFNVLAIKAPGFGDRKKDMLADIATITGASLISEELGKKLETVELSDLGRAKRVVSDKETTTIVGGSGNKENIKARITDIKVALDKTESSFEKEKLQERLGKLSAGVAVIKVGAATESAQKELKQRVEDAVAATRAAMEEGIVPGGGMALFNVPAFKEEADPIKSAAHKILRKAMEAPIHEIIKNSGEQAEAIVSKLRERSEGDIWTGFNANTNKIENLKEVGILDPLKVTKTALTNAISVASTYLMMGVAMTELPKKDEPQMPMGGGMMGM